MSSIIAILEIIANPIFNCQRTVGPRPDLLIFNTAINYWGLTLEWRLSGPREN